MMDQEQEKDHSVIMSEYRLNITIVQATKKSKHFLILADMADFAEMNEVYASFFEGVCPARSAVAVKTLPKEARVEIECIAVR